jgi:hypothetical protein
MYKYYHKRFNYNDFEITKREVIFSISIIAIMFLIGFLISNKISEYYMDKYEVYNKAVKLESTELLKHGMKTNVGNAFIYGDLESVDTVTYPEIGGEYMYVKKVKERYTQHTRTVTETYRDAKGKTHTRTRIETYWSWDYAGSEDKKCNEITFCGVKFNSDKINIPDCSYIDTIKESSHIRYKYYGTDIKHTGTIFTDLRDGTITNNTPFYENKTISETIEYLESGIGLIIFWVMWIILIIAAVIGFYYLDNNWLESE